MSYRAEIAAMLRNMPSDWRAQYRLGREALRKATGRRLPDVPTPEQAMLLVGITAGGNESNEASIGPTGPKSVPNKVREEAMQGLRLSHKHNYGAWYFIGIARAIQLALAPGVTSETQGRMRNYFTRHAKDKKSARFGSKEHPSRGYMAWLNWGGDAGLKWVGGAKKNPLERPTDSIAFTAMAYSQELIELYIYDVNDLRKPERALVAGAMLTRNEEGQWQAMGMAAVKGFGPLLYDLAAMILDATLYPTNDRTTAALSFWSKQPEPYIQPLSDREFEDKYGTSYGDLESRGVELTDTQLRAMRDLLTYTFWSARQSENQGLPIRLPREIRS